MTDRYSDMVNLPHYQSNNRKHMPPIERAAQFAPFAALTGFGAQISETARLTDSRPVIGDRESAQIDEALRVLTEHAAEQPQVKLTVFVPDSQKPGGALVPKEGRVRRVDPVARVMIFTDKTSVFINDIFSLDICTLSWYHKE